MQTRSAIAARDYCRQWCPNSMGWPDAKRLKCRQNTPCTQYSEWILDDAREVAFTELIKVCAELVSRCEVLDEEDCPTKLLCRARAGRAILRPEGRAHLCHRWWIPHGDAVSAGAQRARRVLGGKKIG